MADTLTEDDIKFYLSIEPDEEAVRKAVEQINRDIEREKVEKVRIGIEATMAGLRPEPPKPKYGKTGEFLDRTDHGGVFRQATRGLKGDEGLGDTVKGMGKQLASDMKSVWQGITGGGGAAKAAGGAAAGTAGGIAVGAAVVGAEELAKGIGLLAAAPFKAVNAGLQQLRNGLQGMQGPLGGIGAGLNLASDLFGMIADGVKKIPIIGQLLGPMLDQLGKMPKVLGEITQAGISMAEKANPGAVRQLNIALSDAMATIGQAFVPVIEEMIPIIREIGTIIAQALPSNEEMRTMFRELFESIRDLVKELAPLAGPMLKAVVAVVKALADVVTLIAKVLGPALRPIIAIVNAVASAISALAKGLGAAVDFIKAAIRKIPFIGKWLVGDDKPDESKRGAIAAARPAWMGGIAEYQQRLQLQTATGPAGFSKEDMPRNVGNLAQMVGNIEKWFAKMTPQQFESIVTSGRTGPNATRKTVDAAERMGG